MKQVVAHGDAMGKRPWPMQQDGTEAPMTQRSDRAIEERVFTGTERCDQERLHRRTASHRLESLGQHRRRPTHEDRGFNVFDRKGGGPWKE